MDTATLKAEPRQANGTRAARRLRRDGKIPAIVYGHGEAPEAIAVNAHELSLLIEHGAHLIELQVNGSPHQVLIKDVQFEHLGINPVHVDFVRVSAHERVTVKVPLELKGTPVGTNEGGMLEHELVDIEIECLATEIPDVIRVNVADLRVGQSLHVREVALPDNVTAVTPAETIVCTVRLKKVAEEAVVAAAEAAATEPELIRRREAEEAEEESEKK